MVELHPSHLLLDRAIADLVTLHDVFADKHVPAAQGVEVTEALIEVLLNIADSFFEVYHLFARLPVDHICQLLHVLWIGADQTLQCRVLVHRVLADEKAQGVGLFRFVWVIEIEIVGHISDVLVVGAIDFVASHVLV